VWNKMKNLAKCGGRVGLCVLCFLLFCTGVVYAADEFVSSSTTTTDLKESTLDSIVSGITSVLSSIVGPSEGSGVTTEATVPGNLSTSNESVSTTIAEVSSTAAEATIPFNESTTLELVSTTLAESTTVEESTTTVEVLSTTVEVTSTTLLTEEVSETATRQLDAIFDGRVFVGG
jgi:hypothetical protein